MVKDNISGPILIPWTPRKVVTMVEEARAAGAGVVVGGRPSDVGELHFQLVSHTLAMAIFNLDI